MTAKVNLPNNRIDYENIGQTEAQFRVLYGEEKEWSNTTKAVYDILINRTHRSQAKITHGVKAQTIFAFLVRNKQKHEGMFHLKGIQDDYEAAGKIKGE